MKFSSILILGSLVALSSCREGCKDPAASNYDPKAKKDGLCLYTNNPEDFDRGPMLQNIGENVILPAYNDLTTNLTNLENSFSAFELNPSQATLDALRADWEIAITSWQHAGYFEFGPAENRLFRANMNVYPVDTTQVETNIDNGGYDLASVANLDAKGFQAVDYLLNGVGETDTEIIQVYTTDVEAAQRMQYLSDVVADMKTRSEEVYNDWNPSGGDYIATFISNTGLDIGGSTNMLFNAMVMHFEQYVRSGKLGIPAGALSFTQTPLPDKVECYYHGNMSISLLDEALDALYNIYNGLGANGSLDGFKEYLDYLNTNGPEGLLADDINTQISTAIADVNAVLQNPLSSFVVDNQANALEVWSELQTLVVLLKNDMKSAIGLSITYADADGD